MSVKVPHQIPQGWRDPRKLDYPYLKLVKWRTKDRFLAESEMIKAGGQLRIDSNGNPVASGGTVVGEGIGFHFQAAICSLWPTFEWHKWSLRFIQAFAEQKECSILGPASSGKTFCAAAYCLTSFFIWPRESTIFMSSTTKEMLELRVWGETKNLFNIAKAKRDYLPGYLLSSRTMLTGSEDEDEAQDFRCGIIGVACLVGDVFRGISNYVGVKNNRIILAADEASLMGRGFLDALSNLSKGAQDRFQAMFLGNPKDPTDALGTAAEPHPSAGGWAGYTGEAITTEWRTRRNGLAIQVCGYDSPNYDYPRDQNPFKGIIKPYQIEEDLAYYGEGTQQFAMMNLGVMPAGTSTRRVLNYNMGEKGKAFEEVIWGSGNLTHVVGVDAAYKGVGGDRAPLVHLAYGTDIDGKELISFMGPIQLIPIDGNSKDSPEDQIAMFIRDYCVKHRIPAHNMGLDSTGRGTLVSALARLWSPEVVAVEFGGKPQHRNIRDGDPKHEDEAYGKMVSALWFATYYLVDSGQLRNCPKDAFDEGCLREWGIARKTANGDPVVDVETKDKTKKRLGRSPDLWDAMVVALEVARRRGFKISAGGAGFKPSARKMPDWISSADQNMKTMRKSWQMVPA